MTEGQDCKEEEEELVKGQKHNCKLLIWVMVLTLASIMPEDDGSSFLLHVLCDSVQNGTRMGAEKGKRGGVERLRKWMLLNERR